MKIHAAMTAGCAKLAELASLSAGSSADRQQGPLKGWTPMYVAQATPELCGQH